MHPTPEQLAQKIVDTFLGDLSEMRQMIVRNAIEEAIQDYGEGQYNEAADGYSLIP